jgi:hypothetical protein
VRLTFIIFPTHVDLQRRISDFHLDEYRRLKQALQAMAPTYDFDYANDMTGNRDNFSDPYHYNRAAGQEIVREVWGGQTMLARISQPQGEARLTAR